MGIEIERDVSAGCIVSYVHPAIACSVEIHVGEIIAAVNDSSLAGLSYSQMLAALDGAGEIIQLQVVRKTEKIFLTAVDVALHKEKSTHAIGLTLEGEQGPPLVKCLADDSPVQNSGRVWPKQKLLAVNGIVVDGHQHATSIIKKTEGKLVLTLAHDSSPRDQLEV